MWACGLDITLDQENPSNVIPSSGLDITLDQENPSNMILSWGLDRTLDQATILHTSIVDF